MYQAAKEKILANPFVKMIRDQSVYFIIIWVLFVIYKIAETIYLNSKARK
jgi:hypothetical protein